MNNGNSKQTEIGKIPKERGIVKIILHPPMNLENLQV